MQCQRPSLGLELIAACSTLSLRCSPTAKTTGVHDCVAGPVDGSPLPWLDAVFLPLLIPGDQVPEKKQLRRERISFGSESKDAVPCDGQAVGCGASSCCPRLRRLVFSPHCTHRPEQGLPELTSFFLLFCIYPETAAHGQVRPRHSSPVIPPTDTPTLTDTPRSAPPT